MSFQDKMTLKRSSSTLDNDESKRIKLENASNLQNTDKDLLLIQNDNRANNNSSTTSQKQADQDTAKLNDALAAAGVDIQHEEELLFQQQLNRKTTSGDGVASLLKVSKPPSFLNNYHLAAFMGKVAKENGIHQNFLQDGELLELMSAACENWIANMATKTIILSKHRRRGIPNLNKKFLGNLPRSEISKELKNLAQKQKDLEDKRVQKRIALGLEKGSADDDDNNRAGAEETLHRAANATAAMMASNPKKKYSWMTSSAGGDTGGAKNGNSGDKDKGKQSPIISIRGDNGLRFREIRSTNAVVLKDLLSAIEGEKKGVKNAIIKGYAKLKD
ncbi:unnamed protein product [Candida verbasci]|uniref:Transcription initiation factor TFIID subunit 4 n=1 Tax=Candida verbasci TaxID=1227364 RepID=A0A9W4XLC1_9ASCO|nr:unnamed protein product [Candida verbasci]